MPPPLHAAILFPGQGSRLDGARELVERHCPDLYACARELLGVDPIGHAHESTRFAQPAIYLAALSGWRAAQLAGVSASCFAGHSLGEITALTAAGVFTPIDGLYLIVQRAQLMDQAAQRTGPSGMLAVLRSTVEQAQTLARECGAHAANYNAPDQTIISGPEEALEHARTLARERGIRVLTLDVHGAFHSPAMASAVVPFRDALARTSRRAGERPVFSGMTGEPFSDPVAELAEALCAPVRWTDTIAAIARTGARTYLDVGPDRVLVNLAARNVPDAEALGIEELAVHA